MIKTLSRSLREYKKGSALTIFLSILEAAFEILIPLCMAEVIDKGIDLGNMSNVWKYGIALLIFAAFQLITGVLSAHIAAKTSVGFSANLRQDMYDNVQTFAVSNIDKFSTVSIVTRLTTDATNIQNAYQMLIRMAIRGPVMLIFSMIVSFRINRTIAWIFLAVIPIMAILLLFIVKNVNPVFNRVFHTYDRLNNIVQENVRGIRVVKSFNREDYETGKFKGISKNIYGDFAKGERLLALNSPIMQFFMYACMILISWIGAKAIVESGNNAALGMTTGDLTALFSYAMQILMSLMMLSMIFAMLTISLASAHRIAEILDEKTDIANPGSPEMVVENGSIHFENVDFVYASKADKKVLNNINLSIVSGETVIKIFCHEEKVKEELREKNKDWAMRASKANGYANSIMPMMNALGYVQYVIIAILGGFMAIHGITNLGLTGTGTHTLGMIASFLTLSRSFTNPVSQISNQFNAMVTALAGASRMYALFAAGKRATKLEKIQSLKIFPSTARNTSRKRLFCLLFHENLTDFQK